jgi:hypothetical protein
MDNLEKVSENEGVTNQVEEQSAVSDFILPCRPGDEAWRIERFSNKTYHVKKDKVKMVGFTTSNIQITFEGFQFIGSRPYVWNENVFATEAEARDALKKKLARSEKLPQPLVELITKFKSNNIEEN